mmetsp:Transcript_35218/g.90093  ORF Transcript_35218/g.90093 Transcript_35218/m.90093 type:complete len:275 (-) Transcript_35218:314-1138(-)
MGVPMMRSSAGCCKALPRGLHASPATLAPSWEVCADARWRVSSDTALMSTGTGTHGAESFHAHCVGATGAQVGAASRSALSAEARGGAWAASLGCLAEGGHARSRAPPSRAGREAPRGSGPGGAGSLAGGGMRWGSNSRAPSAADGGTPGRNMLPLATGSPASTAPPFAAATGARAGLGLGLGLAAPRCGISQGGSGSGAPLEKSMARMQRWLLAKRCATSCVPIPRHTEDTDTPVYTVVPGLGAPGASRRADRDSRTGCSRLRRSANTSLTWK